MIVGVLLVFAVYLIVAHWTTLLQGGSVVPFVMGFIAFLAAWPALGWKLALLAFFVDPGSLMCAPWLVASLWEERRAARR
ncbi:MAG TPA: hypothetical protein VMZ53_31370 [Kofleriaceae bacterium]|nr:hypothetical protein [Kofleriaceae bacterium]